MAIMPATLKQGQKLLADLQEQTRGQYAPGTLRLDQVVGSLVQNVGMLYSINLGDKSPAIAETTREHLFNLAEATAMAMDLSSTPLERLHATTSRSAHQSLVGLHSLTSELVAFYDSSCSGFELALQRMWAYLIQHSSTIAGKSLASLIQEG